MDSIRRFVLFLGFAGLGWIGYTLVAGNVTLFDAGIRSAAVLGAVLVMLALIRGGIRVLAASLDP